MTQGFLKAVNRAEREFSPAVIFDVGANLGQSTELFSSVFPHATIYLFEPAQATFAILQGKLGSDPRMVLHRLALDQAAGEVKFTGKRGSTDNRILRGGETGEQVEIVKSITGDAFCAEHKLSEIDILKIDTEGNDLRVLVGFVELLRLKRIKYIQVECTTSPDNRFHVQLDRFMHFLHPFGYRIFGQFEFTRQIFKTKQKLNGAWFCNAVFVREVENPRLRKEHIN